ncbi:hypothetical protein BGX24_006547 [Mortierella sp. AD032]|nr:hypothetical protein BGX24_006547 [Mortierella sp. AD032]
MPLRTHTLTTTTFTNSSMRTLTGALIDRWMNGTTGDRRIRTTTRDIHTTTTQTGTKLHTHHQIAFTHLHTTSIITALLFRIGDITLHCQFSSTAGAGAASDPEGRYTPTFLNDDLHEQDIRDPYVKRLSAASDGSHQIPLSPSPISQPRNVGSTKTSAIVNLSASSGVTSGSPSSPHTAATTSSGAGAAGGSGTSLPVRGGPSTAYGGLVTTASGAPTAAIPGLVFSSRGDNLGSRTQFHAPLEPEVVAKLDDIFFKFLQRICSDLKACDAKGDHM